MTVAWCMAIYTQDDKIVIGRLSIQNKDSWSYVLSLQPLGKVEDTCTRVLAARLRRVVTCLVSSAAQPYAANLKPSLLH